MPDRPWTTQRILERITEIAAAPDSAEVWRLTVEALAGIGFDRVNYGFTRYRYGRSIGDPRDALFLSSHPKETTREFYDQGLYARTPMFRWVAENVGAQSWQWARDQLEAGSLPPDEERALLQSYEMGKVAGYSLSFPPSSERTKGAMGLCARAGQTQADVDALWALDGTAIEALCNTAHLRLSQLPFPLPGVGLSDRQWEILGWIADGKTMQDVTVLTGLSLSAVEKYLRRARDELGVETTAQAVAKAAFLNQLYVRGDPAPLDP